MMLSVYQYIAANRTAGKQEPNPVLVQVKALAARSTSLAFGFDLFQQPA
jgi:hypothetical protein